MYQIQKRWWDDDRAESTKDTVIQTENSVYQIRKRCAARGGYKESAYRKGLEIGPFQKRVSDYRARLKVVDAGRGITLYRTIRFKERIQCIGPSEFTGPRESVNVIPNNLLI